MTIYDDKTKIGNITDRSRQMGSKEKGKVVNKEHWGKDSDGVSQTYVIEHKGKPVQSAGSADAQRTGDYAKVTKNLTGKEAANTAIDSAVDQMEETFDKTDAAHGGKKDLEKSGSGWGAKMSALKGCFGKMAKGDAAPPPPPPPPPPPLSGTGSQDNVAKFNMGLGKSDELPPVPKPHEQKVPSQVATLAAVKHRVANVKLDKIQVPAQHADTTPKWKHCVNAVKKGVNMTDGSLEKGPKVEIQPHPADVIDVDPKVLAVMKHKLASQSKDAGPKKPVKDMMDDSVHYTSKKD